MRLVSVETLRPAVQPNVCFVRLVTDSNVVGLGEVFYGASAVEAYIHDTAAPLLFGLSDLSVESAARALRGYVGYQGAGVETRANGAIDIAIWDLLGKRAGLPLYDLLGGLYRHRIRAYNTCAGSRYVSISGQQSSANWGLDRDDVGPFEDLFASMHRPAQLARELLGSGLTAMKIWPFDCAAEQSMGVEISRSDLDEGVAIIEKIRSEVGFEMDILLELHGLWSVRGAAAICDAVTPFAPYWVEDPLRPDDLSGLSSLRSNTDLTVATGETVVGRRGFLPLLERRSIDVLTVDIAWTGGLTEAHKIATLGDAYGVPIAPHDCTGPITLATAVHLTCSQPNGLIQETARAFLNSWYSDVATGQPEVVDGWISPSPRPGHGVELASDLDRDSATIRRMSRA